MLYVVAELRQQVEEVKSIMEQEIEQVFDRGERLDKLEERVEGLNSAAMMFKRQSHKLVNSCKTKCS